MIKLVTESYISRIYSVINLTTVSKYCYYMSNILICSTVSVLCLAPPGTGHCHQGQQWHSGHRRGPNPDAAERGTKEKALATAR